MLAFCHWNKIIQGEVTLAHGGASSLLVGPVTVGMTGKTIVARVCDGGSCLPTSVQGPEENRKGASNVTFKGTSSVTFLQPLNGFTTSAQAGTTRAFESKLSRI